MLYGQYIKKELKNEYFLTFMKNKIQWLQTVGISERVKYCIPFKLI